MTLEINHTGLATRTLCFAAPLMPGTSSTDREEMLACWTGERGEAHKASRRRHGITRESVWIQGTPAGVNQSARSKITSPSAIEAAGPP